MSLPDGPLLLAVSDESFLFEAKLNVPPQGGFAGLCAYHLDTTFSAVGLSSEAMEIHTSIGGYRSKSCIPVRTDKQEITWLLKRRSAQVTIGYRLDEEQPVVWVSQLTLPGIEQSLSFGPYFSNHTNQSMQGWMHSIRYTKEA